MRKYFSIFGILIPLLFLGAGCLGLGGTPAQIKPVTLEYWRVDDEPESIAAVIEAYRKVHPNVAINYKKFRREDYQRNLLEAFAEDRGPDIFSVPNVWMRGWKAKIQPMPKEITIPTQTVNAQKKIVTVNEKKTALTIRELLNIYVEVVAKDVVLFETSTDPAKPPAEKIFGLPLSVDTLGLFYNIDLLKKADLAKPPTSWRELQDQATAMTILDGEGGQTVRQSGAALGTADNIAHYTEIMAAIMMQNGAIMTDDYGYATFHQYPPGENASTYPPGVEALQFYVSFAAKNAPNRTWDGSMPNSLDAFITGRTAFYFGYPIEAGEIHTRAPSLNFAIAALPQNRPSQPFNVALYPVEVVSKKTPSPNEAWDFLQFLASQEQVSSYLNASRRPTALRGLISSQLTNPDIATFATQVLTAKSWYKGTDYEKVEEAFRTMINTKPTIQHPEWQTIVSDAVSAVNATIAF